MGSDSWCPNDLEAFICGSRVINRFLCDPYNEIAPKDEIRTKRNSKKVHFFIVTKGKCTVDTKCIVI